MRLHTKRGIRLGLAVGIELFLGFVLVAPFGGEKVSLAAVLIQQSLCGRNLHANVSYSGELSPVAIQVQEGCMWAAFTR